MDATSFPAVGQAVSEGEGNAAVLEVHVAIVATRRRSELGCRGGEIVVVVVVNTEGPVTLAQRVAGDRREQTDFSARRGSHQPHLVRIADHLSRRCRDDQQRQHQQRCHDAGFSQHSTPPDLIARSPRRSPPRGTRIAAYKSYARDRANPPDGKIWPGKSLLHVSSARKFALRPPLPRESRRKETHARDALAPLRLPDRTSRHPFGRAGGSASGSPPEEEAVPSGKGGPNRPLPRSRSRRLCPLPRNRSRTSRRSPPSRRKPKREATFFRTRTFISLKGSWTSRSEN